MKYSINNYASAFMEVLKKDSSEKIIISFIKLLKKTGDIKHAGKILEAIHKKIINKKGGKWIIIETARESSSVFKLKSKFSEKDHIEFKINPELVAGARITIDGENELNNTLQNKLNKLFK